MLKLIDKWLIRLTVLFFVVLIISQILLQYDAVRLHISKVDQLEGVPYKPQAWTQS